MTTFLYIISSASISTKFRYTYLLPCATRDTDDFSLVQNATHRPAVLMRTRGCVGRVSQTSDPF